MTRRILRYAATLAGVAAAAAIVTAPTAAAAGQDCTYVGGSQDTVCQSPGNTEINDSPPVTFGWQYPYWYGGGGYWGGYGGFGGGFGHGGHR